MNCTCASGTSEDSSLSGASLRSLKIKENLAASECAHSPRQHQYEGHQDCRCNANAKRAIVHWHVDRMHTSVRFGPIKDLGQQTIIQHVSAHTILQSLSRLLV